MVAQPTATRNMASTRRPKPSTACLPRPTTGKQRPTATPSKAAYKPRIQFAGPNDYLVPSESYAPHLVYLVTVLGAGMAVCECDGFTYRKTCKHATLCLAIHTYRQSPSHLRPVTQPVSWESLAAECAALPVADFTFRAASTPPAFIPAPPAFADLFAA